MEGSSRRLIGKPYVFEFVRRKSHPVHALAQALETCPWFETVFPGTAFAVVAAGGGVVVTASVADPIGAHPGHRHFVLGLRLLLLLLLSQLLVRLSVFSPLVVEPHEELLLFRQFHRFLRL